MKKDKENQNNKIVLNESSLGSELSTGEKEETEDFWWVVKKTLNPPIYATIIAIPLALIPYMKEYVWVGSGSVFANNVFLATTVLGGTVSPMINILLGSNLSHGYPPTADISW
jgi:predicted permease